MNLANLRERVIIRAAEGETQAAIARGLGVSQPTVCRLVALARQAGLLPGRTSQRERPRARVMGDAAFLRVIRNSQFLARLGAIFRKYEATCRKRFAFDRDDFEACAFETLLGLPEGNSASWYATRIEWTFRDTLALDRQPDIEQFPEPMNKSLSE